MKDYRVAKTHQPAHSAAAFAFDGVVAPRFSAELRDFPEGLYVIDPAVPPSGPAAMLASIRPAILRAGLLTEGLIAAMLADLARPCDVWFGRSDYDVRARGWEFIRWALALKADRNAQPWAAPTATPYFSHRYLSPQ